MQFDKMLECEMQHFKFQEVKQETVTKRIGPIIQEFIANSTCSINNIGNRHKSTNKSNSGNHNSKEPQFPRLAKALL